MASLAHQVEGPRSLRLAATLSLMLPEFCEPFPRASEWMSQGSDTQRMSVHMFAPRLHAMPRLHWPDHSPLKASAIRALARCAQNALSTFNLAVPAASSRAASEPTTHTVPPH